MGSGNKITLQADTDYYLESWHREGGGGDHGAIAVKLASEADPPTAATNSAETASDGTSIRTRSPRSSPSVLPEPMWLRVRRSISTVVAQSAPAMTYQWYHNKKKIRVPRPATYSIAKAGVADIGDYVEVSNKNGTVSSFPDDDVRVTLKGAFVIEMEDNYDSGKTVAAASTMPLASGLYEGKDGIPDVDYHSGSVSGSADNENGNSYRNGWVDGNQVVHPAPAGTVATSTSSSMTAVATPRAPDFTLGHNYKIGWGGTGNWFNYTRIFDAGTYAAVFVGSRDGRDAAAMGRTLALVTGDITKLNRPPRCSVS